MTVGYTPGGNLVFADTGLTMTLLASVGSDGLIYGANGLTVARTDGATRTDGYWFGATAEHSGSVGSIIWSTRTEAGYVVVTSDNTDTWVWFSTAFDSGYSKVLTITGHVAASQLGIPPPQQTLTGETVLFLGIWDSGGTSKPMYGSFDGGETWTLLRDTVVVNGGVNCHWHTACYHAQTDRVWLSGGDGVNAWFGYSDDRGETWVDVPTPTSSPLYDGSTYQQPTVMIPFPDRISVGPDRGPFAPGIWTVDPDTGETTATFEVDPTVTTADQQYPIHPFAQDGDTAYVAFPASASKSVDADQTYIAGTGDAGQSWHLLYTLEWGLDDNADFGIVGPDANGYLYMKTVAGIVRAKSPEWFRPLTRTVSARAVRLG